MSTASDILHYQLDNGLTVLLWPHEFSKSVAVSLSVGSGARNETPQNAGVAHYLEHIISNVTDEWSDKRELSRFIEEGGMYRNAYTSQFMTAYVFEGQPEQLTEMLNYARQIVFHSHLDEESVEKERGVIFEEWKMGIDDPSGYASKLVSEIMFRGHPLAQPIIGYDHTIKQLQLHDFMSFYSQHYVPENAVLSVVGAFSAEDLQAWIQSHYASYKRGESTPPRGYHNGQVEIRFGSGKRDIEYGLLRLDIKGPAPHTPEWFIGQVLSVMLFGGIACVFQRELLDEKQVIDDYAFGWNTNTDVSVLQLELQVDPNKIHDVLFEVGKIYSSVKNGSLTESELERAQHYLKTSVASSFQDLSNKCDVIARQYHLTQEVFDIVQFFERIDAVTLGDIEVFAQSFFAPQSMGCVYVGADVVSSNLVDILEKELKRG